MKGTPKFRQKRNIPLLVNAFGLAVSGSLASLSVNIFAFAQRQCAPFPALSGKEWLAFTLST
jgi:hypothetical protein